MANLDKGLERPWFKTVLNYDYIDGCLMPIFLLIIEDNITNSEKWN
jgi:hypothetical protein